MDFLTWEQWPPTLSLQGGVEAKCWLWQFDLKSAWNLSWVSPFCKCVLTLNGVWKRPESLRYRMCEWLHMLKFGEGKKEKERNFPCWGSGHFNRHFNGQSVQLSHQCRWTCVHQFSPLLAVLFFCSRVCNGVNSWTPLLFNTAYSCAFCRSFSLLPSLCFSHGAKLRQLVLDPVCLTKCL